ncbi:MAG: DNA-3-methyladenine glycosylase 2 family protein, partial [Clostridiales bacterium]|nr:DNA-3-methyladenine glycosylase 2 family protein [Clostridiales bacterium]
ASRVFDCGQSFRFDEADGVIDGIAFGKRIKIKQDGDTLTIIGATAAEYAEVWEKYLGLDEDYDAINADILEKFGVYNGVINDAVKAASGIRILRQDHWEALCSFIISQNNNIPRIKGLVQSISRAYGEKFSSFGEECYAFPTPEAVLDAGVPALDALKMGFRSKYIIDAAARVVDGRIDLEKIEEMPFETAEEYLMQIYGVGKKVADCTLLYGYHKTEAFPVDVWIRRVLEKYYPCGVDFDKLGSYAGIAQQYLFCYERYIQNGGK